MLPIQDGLTVDKNADFALGFFPTHRGDAYEVLCQQFLNVLKDQRFISHMGDTDAGMILLGPGLEVKEFGGSQTEALLQVGIYSVAWLQKICQLIMLGGEMPSSDNVPPIIGWTVVGHDWKAYLTSLQSDGSIVSVPTSILSLLYADVFCLDGRRSVYPSHGGNWKLRRNLQGH
jgi:hypothetical protein